MSPALDLRPTGLGPTFRFIGTTGRDNRPGRGAVW